MTPTVEQRLEIYQYAVNDMVKDHRKKSYYTGICSYVSYANRKLGYENRDWCPYENMSRYYPEIHLFKPYQTYDGYWFPIDIEGMKARIKILRKVIRQCKLLIKNNESI